MRRADAIVLTRVERADAAAGAGAESTIARTHPTAPLFHARFRGAGLRDERGSPVDPATLAGRRLVAVCGVADSSQFAATLSGMGLAPEELVDFRDHQRYRERHVARIERVAEQAGAAFVVTTEKDAVKLEGKLNRPILTVRLAVDVVEPGFFPFLAARLASAAAAASAKIPRAQAP